MKKTAQSKRRSQCPISFGLDIFGDKWSLLLLRDILFYNRRRFTDFVPQEGIATNILAERLRRLALAGIIARKRSQISQNEFIYEVTKKGRELTPVLVELSLWGLRYDPRSLASRKFVRRIEKSRERAAKEMAESIAKGSFTEYRRAEIGISRQAPD